MHHARATRHHVGKPSYQNFKVGLAEVGFSLLSMIRLKNRNAPIKIRDPPIKIRDPLIKIRDHHARDLD